MCDEEKCVAGECECGAEEGECGAEKCEKEPDSDERTVFEREVLYYIFQSAHEYELFLRKRSLVVIELPKFVVLELPPPEKTLENIQSSISELFDLYYTHLKMGKYYHDEIPIFFMSYSYRHYNKLKINDLWCVYKTVYKVFDYINEHKKLKQY